MGVVYLARHLRLNRVVALKMVISGEHASEAQKERFLVEAQAVAALQHPNIVQIFESGTHGELPYFSLEFIDGGSLAAKVREQPLTATEAATLVEQIARGVHYAHERGIVHRDLKPDNVLLTKDGTPKVTDFGLAKRIESDSGMTQSGAIMGTPSYMAPEQASGKTKEVGPLADVWALGAILYRLLTGRPPFQAPTALETVKQVVTHEPVAPRHLQPKVPRDLETITLKCLQKESNKRYTSAAEFADDLGRFLRDEPIAARPVARLERGWRWCRRHPAIASLVGAVAGSLVLGSTIAIVLAAWALREAGRAETNATRFGIEAERAKTNEARAIANEQTVRRHEKLSRTAIDELVKKTRHPGWKNTPQARQVLAAARRYYEDFVRDVRDDPEMRREHAFALSRFAALVGEIGDKKEAAAFYEQSIGLLKSLTSDGDETAETVLADQVAGLGRMYLELGRNGDAETTLNDARSRYRALAETTPTSRNGLADTYLNLGNLYETISRRKDAEGAYRQALTLRLALLADDPEDDALRLEVAQAHTNLAGLHSKAGRHEALNDFRESLKIFASLATKYPEVADFREGVATAQYNVGYQSIIASDWATAEKALGISIEVREKLVGDQGSVMSYRERLAETYIALGSLYQATGRDVNAGDVFLKAQSVYRKLTEGNRSVPSYRSGLAFVNTNLGRLYASQDKLDAAEPLYREAIKTLDELSANEPENLEHRWRLANTRLDLANLYSATRRPAEAEATLRAAQAVCRKLAEENPATLVFSELLAKTHNNLGNHYYEANRLKDAEAEHLAALEVRQRLVARNPAIASYREGLAKSHHNLGAVRATDGRRQEAEANYRTALELRRKLAADNPAVKQFAFDFADTLLSHGQTLARLARNAVAMKHFAEARIIWRQLIESTPNAAELRRKLAETEEWIGALNTGGREDAESAAFRAAKGVQSTISR